MKNSKLGPSFSDEEIRNFLESINAKYTYIESDSELVNLLVDNLLDGKKNSVFAFNGRNTNYYFWRINIIF